MGLSRRDLLTIWRRPAPEPEPGPPAAEPTPSGRYPLEPAVRSPRGAAFVVRPPGAGAEAAFVDACQRCGRCVAACPHDAIQVRDDGTPHIDAAGAPCQLCAGIPCAPACPSGALTPLDDPRAVRIGTAVIDAGECLAYRGAPCRACVDVCPLPGVLQLTPGRRMYVPAAGPEACTGCGLCVRYCPNPAAIRIAPAEGRVRVESA